MESAGTKPSREELRQRLRQKISGQRGRRTNMRQKKEQLEKMDQEDSTGGIQQMMKQVKRMKEQGMNDQAIMQAMMKNVTDQLQGSAEEVEQAGQQIGTLQEQKKSAVANNLVDKVDVQVGNSTDTKEDDSGDDSSVSSVGETPNEVNEKEDEDSGDGSSVSND